MISVIFGEVLEVNVNKSEDVSLIEFLPVMMIPHLRIIFVTQHVLSQFRQYNHCIVVHIKLK